MAVKFEDVKNKLVTEPLSLKEGQIIENIERFIDDKINTEFDNKEIIISEQIMTFKFDPITKQTWAFGDIKDTRKHLMTRELISRYEAAGWSVGLERGEDDGPNRPAMDYYVFKGR